METGVTPPNQRIEIPYYALPKPFREDCEGIRWAFTPSKFDRTITLPTNKVRFTGSHPWYAGSGTLLAIGSGQYALIDCGEFAYTSNLFGESCALLIPFDQFALDLPRTSLRPTERYIARCRDAIGHRRAAGIDALGAFLTHVQSGGKAGRWMEAGDIIHPHAGANEERPVLCFPVGHELIAHPLYGEIGFTLQLPVGKSGEDFGVVAGPQLASRFSLCGAITAASLGAQLAMEAEEKWGPSARSRGVRP